MASYVGIHTQQSRNNFKTTLLLLLFPILVLALVYAFVYILNTQLAESQQNITGDFQTLAPFVMGAVLLWFLIAYAFNNMIINRATGSKPLERKENKRVYNLVENLCIANGMQMPKVNIIEDNSLNAFASGINKKSYTVTLTRGIINRLDDSELEAVIAHELSHIRNHDVRLLIVSIVFVGIFTFVSQVAIRMAFYSSSRRSNDKNNGAAVIMIVVAVLSAVGYLFAMLLRFAISRKREYMADASAAEMTKQPLALASALRKISSDPVIESVGKRDDVAQLFIEHPLKRRSGISVLFATHPPIKKRISVLEQF